jgi:hypothetical protein
MPSGKQRIVMNDPCNALDRDNYYVTAVTIDYVLNRYLIHPILEIIQPLTREAM